MTTETSTAVVAKTLVGPEDDRIAVTIERYGDFYAVSESTVGDRPFCMATAQPFTTIEDARHYRDALVANYVGPAAPVALDDAEYDDLLGRMAQLLSDLHPGPLDGDQWASLVSVGKRRQAWMKTNRDRDPLREYADREITARMLWRRIVQVAQRDLQCLECGCRFTFEDGTEDWEPGLAVDAVTPTCPHCNSADIEPN